MRLLSASEVASRLGVSTSMAYKLMRSGEAFPVIYIGSAPRVDERDLVAYVERQKAKS